MYAYGTGTTPNGTLLVLTHFCIYPTPYKHSDIFKFLFSLLTLKQAQYLKISMFKENIPY